MIRHSGMDSINLSYPSNSSPIEGPLPSSPRSTSDPCCQPRDSISYLHFLKILFIIILVPLPMFHCRFPDKHLAFSICFMHAS